MRKIPTLFVRDETDRRYVVNEVAPGCEWVLARLGYATRKFDGTCVRVAGDGSLWARREVKRGKPEPERFEAVQEDDATGKIVGWEPAEQSGFAKYIAEAASISPSLPGTYELIGPKVNGNPEGYEAHHLIPHGIDVLPVGMRSFDHIRAWCSTHPEYEGIVFWERFADPTGRMAKIKARDFRRGSA
jgi:hypothetical protein